jgi:phage-related protein
VALEDLEELIESLTGDFEALESPLASVSDLLDNLASTVDVATSALDGLGDALGSLKAGGAAAEDVGEKVKGATDTIESSCGHAASAINTINAALSSIADGPLPSARQAATAVGQAIGGALTSGAHEAAQALSALGPEGEAAGAALEGLAAVASATVGTLATLIGTAIEVSEKLALMRARFDGLAGSAEGGAKVTAMVMRLGQQLPFATDQVAAWAQKLELAGIKGQALERDIKAVAAAAAFGPDVAAGAEHLFRRLGEGGPAADKLLKDLSAGGQRAARELMAAGLTIADLGGQAAVAKMSAEQLHDALAKALQAKGGEALGVMMESWPNIIEKAREGFFSLFGDLGPSVKPFMAEVKGLFSEFSKGGTVINALKPVVTAVLGTLFDWAKKATAALHKGLLYVVVGALTAYIAMRPVIDAIKQLAASENFLTGLKVALVLLALPFAVMAVAIVLVIATVGILVAALGAVVYGIVWLAGAIVGFVASAASALSDWISGAVEAASNFVAGLVQGISSGAGAFVDAVKGLAQSGMNAFTGFFGIRSPSTKMLKHGDENIAGAAATGVDRGAPKVKRAMARLGGEPGTGEGGRGDRGGGGREVHYHYSGPVEHYPTFREHMRRFLEETAAEAGAAPAEAA